MAEQTSKRELPSRAKVLELVDQFIALTSVDDDEADADAYCPFREGVALPDEQASRTHAVSELRKDINQIVSTLRLVEQLVTDYPHMIDVLAGAWGDGEEDGDRSDCLHQFTAMMSHLDVAVDSLIVLMLRTTSRR